MTSRKKWSLWGALLVGVLSLLLIALPGAAAARQHHKGHSHHKKHHKRHHQRRSHHRSGTQTGGGSTATSGDEDNAGTIASFDGTTLTITLLDDSSVSGMVTDDTEIKCEAAGDGNDQGDDNDDQGDDDNSGDDDSGSGGDVRAASAMSTHSDDGGGDDDNSGSGSGDDDSGDGNGEQQCTTADLTPGTQVSEAELSDESGQPTFEEIELVK